MYFSTENHTHRMYCDSSDSLVPRCGSPDLQCTGLGLNDYPQLPAGGLKILEPTTYCIGGLGGGFVSKNFLPFLF